MLKGYAFIGFPATGGIQCSVFRKEKKRLHVARVGKSHFSENAA
jgi:hypothetical protein